MKVFKESGLRVRQVVCASHATAALTFDGKVYTWGMGETLGQGVYVGDGDCSKPTLISSLITHRMCQVSSILSRGDDPVRHPTPLD